MRRLAILALIFLCPAVAGLVSPDSFQPLTTPYTHIQGPDAHGPMYFDSYSYKGVDANIAYFMLGTGFFSGEPNSPDAALAALSYLGNPDGSALASFGFTSSGPVQVQLLYAGGLWAPDYSLGWYDLDSSARGWIFQANGISPSLTTIAFTPSSHFGLFFVPNGLPSSGYYDPSSAYYTDASKNQITAEDVTYAASHAITLGPESGQHFAVIEDSNDPNGLYIGIEDRSLQVGDGDYTDLVLRLSPDTSVPEPRSLLLVAIALVGLGGINRKRLN